MLGTDWLNCFLNGQLFHGYNIYLYNYIYLRIKKQALKIGIINSFPFNNTIQTNFTQFENKIDTDKLSSLLFFIFHFIWRKVKIFLY